MFTSYTLSFITGFQNINLGIKFGSGEYKVVICNDCNNCVEYIFNLIVLGSRELSTIFGNVLYDNNPAKPLFCETKLELREEGALVESVKTKEHGNYEFTPLILEDGKKYTINCIPGYSWGGNDPIDALFITKNYIGLVPIKDLWKKAAADVNNDNKINPLDALMINRRYIHSINKFTI